MSSIRLPGKPLIDLEGIPMVIRVAQQAIKSQVGQVAVACCEKEVFEVVKKYKINAIMTDPNLPSGSDRVYQALQKINSFKDIKIIINLQGDMPTINPKSIKDLLYSLEKSSGDIATLASEITDKRELSDSNVVKVVIANSKPGGKALYFSRQCIPFGDGPVYHHIGIYAFKKDALYEFVNMKPSTLEKRERLEQLRALEGGLTINVKVIDDVPIGVDTQSDLVKVRSLIKGIINKGK